MTHINPARRLGAERATDHQGRSGDRPWPADQAVTAKADAQPRSRRRGSTSSL
ncbi:hypothetical protein AB0M20_03635 [Actinoplanes sp. NPDC051633]|uniref:hypothetical protein n=1 Tax=Actinoplanes sp. NPDC051633 TaxID=3155670 RepID=UPI003424A68C